jgi:hypothetical protein
MPAPSDALLARYQSELEERSQFQQQLVTSATEQGRDLNDSERELYERANARMAELERQAAPLREGARIAADSRARMAELEGAFATARTGNRAGPAVEYRSAGAYVVDLIRAGMGNADAGQRLEVYNRAAAHQTTGDNPGLLPEQIIGPVISNIDASRPLVDLIGPQQVPSGGSWTRPRITQHTLVGKQTAEKTELPSRKLVIEKVPVAADTYGGYVNVSRQNIDWTSPAIMDIVIGDLGDQYALETEQAAADDLIAIAAVGPVIPATPDMMAIATAVWTAAGQAVAATKGGRLSLVVSPDMLGLLGPIMPGVNPTNAQSTGMQAGQFGSGAFASVSGVGSAMSWALPPKTALMFTSKAVEAWEDRIGSLQVVEPSVLGTQVAYAGYFNVLVLEATGVVKITST